MTDCPEIIDRILDGKRKKIKVYPQHIVRASEIAHPCTRYLVYSITNWVDKKPHGPEVEFIFEGGRLVEDLAVQDFIDAGFKVYRPEPDRALMESRPRISAHLDIRVDFGDILKEYGINQKVLTGEIKGLNIFDWEKMNTIEDFMNSKKPWLRKYVGQLTTYMYIKGEEWGFFYLKSVPRFQPKFILVKLDLEYMESLLKKTEYVEECVKNKTLPEQVDDPDMCEYCPFQHICLPDINRDELDFIDDQEFAEMLERREQIKEYAREYNDIDRHVKKRLGDRLKACVGNFLITGKEISRKGYTVEDTTYTRYKIAQIERKD
jgi:hypothetical protein